ncbi:D-glucuronyl C5-epimerase family protein [Georgenia thermotolerans]|uniref:D-glucuronyl C5-epimerase family protein n=1 Tax=Georgenia thermotolerans TaxID=527326 RepID=UPI0014790A66|nr:D-glucuronyl C5-epimerase family protein [Georgenia thermotolerans]
MPLIVCAAAFVTLTGCTSAIPRIEGWEGDDHTGILALPSILEIVSAEPELLDPIIGFAPDESVLENDLQKRIEDKHPTYAVAAVLGSWFRTGETATAKARTEQIIARWGIRDGATRLDYGFEYTLNGEHVEAGWWSGMSDWTFPLLLTALAQETGDDEYAHLRDSMVENALKPVEEGGTLWNEDNGCWISEYAWSGMDRNQESHVLNGHQYALVAMGMIAASTDDSELAKVFQDCSANTVAKLPEFWGNDVWPSYMLHRRTINQPHYAVFEISLFEALARLSGDARYLEAIKERQDAFARTYPVTGVVSDEGSRLIFTQMAGPHPYLRDIYTAQLECSDGDTSESFELPGRGLRLEDSILNEATSLDLADTTCSIWSNNGKSTPTLISRNQRIQLASDGGATRLSYEFGMERNIEWEGKWAFTVSPLEIDSEENDGTRRTHQSAVQLNLEGLLPTTAESGALAQFGVQLTPSAAVNAQIRVISGETICQRNYPNLAGGASNLVLLSVAGFDDCAVDSINSIEVIFSRVGIDAPVTITGVEVFGFPDTEALRVHLEDSGAVIPGVS